MNKPILAVVHIYYPEMWDELKSCLNNITLPYDLYVTTVEQNRYLQDDVMNFKTGAHFEVVENRGYDVGPFVHIINQVNLDDYSYIVKLHTKRELAIGNTGFRGLDGQKWRETLLSFIKTPDVFNQYLKAFDVNKKIGMQANHHVIVHYDFFDEQAQKEIKAYFQKNRLPKRKYAFVAGTMFIAKASVFKDIQNLHLTFSDFPDPKGEHKTQLAHIIERLFGYFVYKNGFIVRDSLITSETEQKYHKKEYIKMKLTYPIIRFFYQKKITKSGKVIIKICKIPVYRK